MSFAFLSILGMHLRKLWAGWKKNELNEPVVAVAESIWRQIFSPGHFCRSTCTSRRAKVLGWVLGRGWLCYLARDARVGFGFVYTRSLCSGSVDPTLLLRREHSEGERQREKETGVALSCWGETHGSIPQLVAPSVYPRRSMLPLSRALSIVFSLHVH